MDAATPRNQHENIARPGQKAKAVSSFPHRLPEGSMCLYSIDLSLKGVPI